MRRRIAWLALAAMGLLAACGRDVDVIWAASAAASGSGGDDATADASGESGAVVDGVCATPSDVLRLAPGHWCEAPASDLRQVVPCDGKQRNLENGNDCDPALGITQEHYNTFALADAKQIVWSNSTVVDEARGRVVLWGGKSGTTEWGGNEIYSFDLEALEWSRETDPPFLTDEDFTEAQEQTGYYVDGTPRARKAHNTLAYLPAIESMCALGAVDLFRDRNSLPNTDCFSFRDGTWRRYDDLPAPSNFASVAVVDPMRGTALLLDTVAGDLYEFDPTRAEGAQWTGRGGGGRRNGGATVVMEPIGQRLFAIGNDDAGQIEIFTQNADGNYSAALATVTGDLTAAQEQWPALAFDPGASRILAWTGGAEAYALDLDTLVFSRLEPAPTNTIVPVLSGEFPSPLGRFRYVATLDAFVLVSDADRNVAFFRPAGPS